MTTDGTLGVCELQCLADLTRTKIILHSVRQLCWTFALCSRSHRAVLQSLEKHRNVRNITPRTCAELSTVTIVHVNANEAEGVFDPDRRNHFVALIPQRMIVQLGIAYVLVCLQAAFLP